MPENLELPLENESIDIAFTVTVMHHNSHKAKLKMVSEMWRVLVPGGHLVFLEDFVTGKQTKKGTVYPMSITSFSELLMEATGGQVVLKDFESVKYKHDLLFRGGCISVVRLGVPARW
jgi:ubiquinone/menaquinone biosynthesis C-methylase UbiE